MIQQTKKTDTKALGKEKKKKKKINTSTRKLATTLTINTTPPK